MKRATLGRIAELALGPRHVRRAAGLVALVVTALVGGILIVTLVIVDLSAPKAQSPELPVLQSWLTFFERNPGALYDRLNANYLRPPNDGGILIWQIDGGGQVTATANAPDLPSEYRTLSGTAEVVMDGHSYKLAGRRQSNGWLVLGVTTELLAPSLGSVISSQAVWVPPLLLGVFLVSLQVGRWAARPIDQARQQQLAFTANASHELRTPLAVVEGEVSLALSRPRTADEYRRSLERVSGETLRLRRLVDGLLWLARVEDLPERPRMERLDLGEASHRAIERFTTLAESRRLSLRLVEDGDAVSVVAPGEWLDRLLGVLLDNACKYTPEGGQVVVSVVGGAGRTELLVDDSGPGIAVAERERIFERFHRASAAADGAGLGLAIGAAVVNATRGQWIVARSPLGGARVGVSWPHTGGDGRGRAASSS